MNNNKKLFYEQFRIASVTNKTNSFGLYGVIILAKSGRAFEIGVGSIYEPIKGKEWSCKLSEANNLLEIEGVGFELPRRLSDAPQGVIDEVFKFQKL